MHVPVVAEGLDEQGNAESTDQRFPLGQDALEPVVRRDGTQIDVGVLVGFASGERPGEQRRHDPIVGRTCLGEPRDDDVVIT